MKGFFSLAISILLLCPTVAQENHATVHFEFHINYWINLHHYLYQKAKGSQAKKLLEDDMTFIPTPEDSIFASMDSADISKINRAIGYYKDHLITKSLRRDLGDFHIRLRNQHKMILADTTFSDTLNNILNEASAVYQKHLWPVHKSLAEQILLDKLPLIRNLEESVIQNMESLAESNWPNAKMVRVDLTAYANYAGAYTVSRPNLNITISTLDPLNNTSSFIETVFHEGSHLLFDIDTSPFRAKIYYKSKDLEMNFPRNLWHASLFYLCGRVIQDHLKERNIIHSLDMDIRNIFSDYNTPAFQQILEGYYRGNYDLDQTVDKLLAEFNP